MAEPNPTPDSTADNAVAVHTPAASGPQQVVSDGASTPENAQATAPRFTSALIVDDAYDPLSQTGMMEQVKACADAIKASDRENELRAILGPFGCPTTGTLDFPGNALEQLYAAEALDAELAELLNKHLFNDIRQKRAQVKALSDGLAARGIKIVTAGSEDQIPTEAPDIVFLDYYLGAVNDEQARSQALSKLRSIESVFATQVPFIVLMSSAVVNPIDQGTFRDESGWVAGLFDFAPKNQLRSRDSLGKLLTLWEMLLPYRRQVFAFVRAVDESVKLLPQKFMKRVRSLGLEDYAFLQRLHLAADGQPLGEYMLWLFGSLLPHLAFDNDPGVSATSSQLDQVRFESLLPADRPPSRAVAECYRLAISTPVIGPVAPHPQHVSTAGSMGLPYLQTGDLLTDNTERVWMVASPACDIAFAPASDRDDPNRFVVLIPGLLDRLTAHSPPAKPAEVATPLYERGGIAYRIIWQPTRPEYVKHGAIDTWLATTHAQREARLRLPYALEVQQAFAQNLTRIGMPIPPPIYFDSTVQVYREGPDAQFLATDVEPGAGACLLLLRKDRRCHLNVDAVRSLIGALAAARATWTAKLAGAKNPGHQDQIQGTINAITKLETDSAEWTRLLGTAFELPEGESPTKIAGGLIRIFCNAQLTGKFPDKTALVINIHESLGVEVAESPAATAPQAATGDLSSKGSG